MAFLCRLGVVIALSWTILHAVPAIADTLGLPAVFSDHMVLQRGVPLPVWGFAEPETAVTVTFRGQTISTRADESGHWRVNLHALEADAKPATMTVTNGERFRTISDVLVGEVWLCSGQSNMEWTVRRSDNASTEIASANLPLIRQIEAPHAPNRLPQADIDAAWQVCSPQTVGDFSAVGYFFGRKLHQELDVPIGLINCTWGGTRIEPWTPVEGFAAVPVLDEMHKSINAKLPTSDAYQHQAIEYLSDMEKWLRQSKRCLAAGHPISEPIACPETFRTEIDRQDPTVLYNGMMAPFVPFALRGAIWYQGEANCRDGMAYVEKTRALIHGWRQKWENPNLPFYFVQIAPFKGHPSVLPEFWEAQASVTDTIPHTGIVVINDIGNIDDIHPTNKQDVGQRLANMALKREYGRKELIDCGPKFREMKTAGNTLLLIFDNVGNGLTSRDRLPISNFELAGESQAWSPARVEIIAPDTLQLSTPGLEVPVAARFAWNKKATPNLINSGGLPAIPFRTDK